MISNDTGIEKTNERNKISRTKEDIMTQEKNVTCPSCQGKKILSGTCECNMEWRGTQKGDDWEDCQCTPDIECSNCHGTGYVGTKT